MAVGPNIAFGIIALAMVAATLFLLSTRNVVHAALYLMVVLAGTAALFILLGAEFLGWTQVLVYIGAVIVLFLFGVMLTRAQLGESDELDNAPPQRVLAVISSGLVFGLILGVFINVFGGDEIRIEGEPIPTVAVEQSVEIEDTPEGEAISGEESATLLPGRVPSVLDRQTTAGELGDELFARWVLPFEAISIVLLAALIGSIVLARRDDPPHVRERGEQVA